MSLSADEVRAAAEAVALLIAGGGVEYVGELGVDGARSATARLLRRLRGAAAADVAADPASPLGQPDIAAIADALRALAASDPAAHAEIACAAGTTTTYVGRIEAQHVHIGPSYGEHPR